ncbi:DUF2157 domain-containing protein [Nocardia speluncae]|uniref:DUF2157 domain-containing protein n=1 Tax=Nocardia speluncae TaxID=419477 RepID=UPI00082AE808
MAEQDSAPEASQQRSQGESRPAVPEPPIAHDPGAPGKRAGGTPRTGRSDAEFEAGPHGGRSPAGTGHGSSSTGPAVGRSGLGSGVGERPAASAGDESGTRGESRRIETRDDDSSGRSTDDKALAEPGGAELALGGGNESRGGVRTSGFGRLRSLVGARRKNPPTVTGGGTDSGRGRSKSGTDSGTTADDNGSDDRTADARAATSAVPVSAPVPQSLVDLVRRGVLDETQLGAVVTALAKPEPRPTPARLLAEIAAYAGAGLLLSGLVLVLAESWDDMAKLGRFVLFVLVAVGLTVAGVATAGGWSALFRPAWSRSAPAGHTARTRLAAVFFALAAVSIAAAAAAILDDGNDTTDLTWVYAAVAGLVAAIAGYAALPSLLGLLLCAGFSAAAVSGLLDEVLGVGDLTGPGLLVLGFGWLGATRFGAVLERWAGYAAGVVLAVAGAQAVDPVDRMWPAYVLTAVVAVVCFAIYASDRSWVLSLGGAAALTLAAVEAVVDWTGESAGASGAILVVGAVVLGIGSYLLTRSAKKSVER